MGECGTIQDGLARPWSVEESRISFLIRSTYDVLPSPQNLNLWVGEDHSCPLCSSPATLRHILTGCKVALSQGLLGTMTKYCDVWL